MKKQTLQPDLAPSPTPDQIHDEANIASRRTTSATHQPIEPWSRRAGARTAASILVFATLYLFCSASFNRTERVGASDGDSIDVFTQSTRAKLIDAMRIDVNRASFADLQLLPGIGPALAQRIVSDRIEHGPFSSINDLVRVRGIGERTVQTVREFAVALPPIHSDEQN